MKRILLVQRSGLILRIAIYFAIWALAGVLAGLIRFEFEVGLEELNLLLVFGVGLAVLGLLPGVGFGLFKPRDAEGSIDRLKTLSKVSALVGSGATFFLIWFGSDFGIPRSLGLIAAMLGLGLLALDSHIRRVIERNIRNGQKARKTIVYGAGQMAEVMIPLLQRDIDLGLNPVAIVDDDLAKHRKVISGVEVRGTGSDLVEIARLTGATVVVVCMTRTSFETLNSIRDLAHGAGAELMVMPRLTQSFQAIRDVSFRPLQIEDLLDTPRQERGQAPRDFLRDKTVLITGAGGSIGSELALQVKNAGVSKLFLLDNDESQLQSAELKLYGTGLLVREDLVLCDIRDLEALREVFSLAKPDIVLHAAALKHLPTLQRFPGEAWKTNVLGTLNVLKAASEFEVSRLVNISTDKAAAPSSFLGLSKLLAERLTAWYSVHSNAPFNSVRFGNVFNSRGSLIPTVRYLINNGLPINVTDATASRYFMSVYEACQLVLSAASIDTRKSTFVLEMGSAISIGTIVERMADLARKPVDIKYSGLRPGEKHSEVLVSSDESLMPTAIDGVSVIHVEPLDPAELIEFRREFEFLTD